MLAFDLARRLLPSAPHDLSARDGHAQRAELRAIEARLRLAARALPDDPDAAALLLDGVLAAIAALQSNSVEHGIAIFGLRLRLALRAPNVEARLVHCRELLRLLEDDDNDYHDEGDSSYVR